MKTLYHGSHRGIEGCINPVSSRALCDFGKGFYTGDIKEQAETLVSNDENGKLYVLSVNLDNLRIYNFDNDVLWALYVGVNRGRIDITKYKKLQALIHKINSNDVIVGLIADDRMMYVYGLFVDGLITDAVLIESLKSVKLGSQYVFKTMEACSQIKIANSEILSEERKKELLHNKSKVIGNIQNVIEDLSKKYRRQGRFIDEILEEYK